MVMRISFYIWMHFLFTPSDVDFQTKIEVGVGKVYLEPKKLY